MHVRYTYSNNLQSYEKTILHTDTGNTGFAYYTRGSVFWSFITITTDSLYIFPAKNTYVITDRTFDEFDDSVPAVNT